MSFRVPKFSGHFRRVCAVPGSKSLTNRVLPLAALGSKDMLIHGALKSEDTEVMIEALRAFGVPIQVQDGEGGNFESIRILGRNGVFPFSGNITLNCKNSGTSLRFLAALGSLRSGNTTLTGIERMQKRPVGDLVTALRHLGIEGVYEGEKGFPPITVCGNPEISGGVLNISGKMSSQFVTALLLLAPFTHEGITLRIADELVSQPYVLMTLELLSSFGIQTQYAEDFSEFQVSPHQMPFPLQYTIEGDATAATYPLGISAVTGGEVTISNISCGENQNFLQGDARFAEKILRRMGCVVNISEKGIHVQGTDALRPLGEIAMEDMPDAAMTAVILAACARGESRITGLSTLRHNECDRIEALVKNLSRMGAKVISGEDWIAVDGDPKTLHGAKIKTYADHRIAMCFAVLGSVVEGIILDDEECVAKTWPTFWREYEEWRK